jgi:hypothetical protein
MAPPLPLIGCGRGCAEKRISLPGNMGELIVEAGKNLNIKFRKWDECLYLKRMFARIEMWYHIFWCRLCAASQSALDTSKWSFRNNLMKGKGVPEIEVSAVSGDEFLVDYVRVYNIGE